MSFFKRQTTFPTQISVLLLFPIIFAGCPRDDVPRNPRVGVSTSSRKPENKRVETGFSGERAMEHVRKQLDIGPRPPDTIALSKTRSYIIEQLRSYGLSISTDDFTAVTPQGDRKMTNIVAEIPGETKELILICSHYDTKFFADMRFVGANDPATSVATLLEIARVLSVATEKPRATYRLVFFDGEEAFCEGWDDCQNPNGPDNTYGSQRYVAQLRARNELAETKAMILLDMIGYKQLELGRDTMSTRWLQDIIWKTGRELGYEKVFVDREEGVGGDDHAPFLKVGIDSVDLIQLSTYPYWHRADDTIDKVSAESMKIVGETVLASLPKIAAKVAR